MKQTFLIFFTFISLFASAKDSTYIINGRFDDIKSGTVYLSIYGSEEKQETARIIDGAFSFKGVIPQPAKAVLSLKDKPDYFVFYVEPGTINLSGKASSLKNIVVSNSQINDQDKLLKQPLQPILQWEESEAKAYQEAANKKDIKVLDSLDEVDFKILHEKRKLVASFIKDHPDFLISAFAIADNYAYYAEADEVEPLYNLLNDDIKNSSKGQEVKKMLDLYKTVAMGMIPPDITQPTPKGTLMSLSSLKGKYVLVDFWASWCGPCRRENPNVVKLYNEFKNKGLEIFGVSYDLKKANWEKAIKDDGLVWYHVSDLKGWQNATSDLYGIKAIPSNLLLNKDGRIIAKNIFGEKLWAKMAEVVNQ
jgi:thiol-disulfide isomerase/thioredoxin